MDVTGDLPVMESVEEMLRLGRRPIIQDLQGLKERFRSTIAKMQELFEYTKEL